MKIQSFPPLAPEHARILILGSMPGVASLARGEYYAHPRNAFWPILGELLGFDPALDYPARIERLQDAGIALWDVLHRCVRPGSLDAAIAPESVEPNDFVALFAHCPRITRIVFNGRAAQDLFERHVAREIACELPADRRLLPSTSPAHAGLARDVKLARWREALEPG